MPDIETVLFDLDGTIIDSIDLIVQSYNHTLAAHGLPTQSREFWLRGIGIPLEVQLARFANSPEQLAELVRTYRAFNLAHHDQMVRPYPGVVEAIRAIAASGRRLGVVTSKHRDGALRGLRLAGVDQLMSVVVCAEDVRNPKPHREPVDRALELLNAPAITAIYVGDSVHDMRAGRAAGVMTGAALWGPFTRADLEPTEPTYWFETPDDLLRLLGLAPVMAPKGGVASPSRKG